MTTTSSAISAIIPTIMGDEHDGHPAFFLKLAQQIQDLSLGGHIQRGGGLIGDQQVGRSQRRGPGQSRRVGVSQR